MNPFDAFLKEVIVSGDLAIRRPSGKHSRHGDGTGKPVALRLKDRKLDWAAPFNPTLAIGEAWMDGRIELEDCEILDLANLFAANIRFHRDNPRRSLLYAGIFRRFCGWSLNTPRRARRNVSHHYDLPPRLYDLFLDKDRQYSCAYFRDPSESLDAAQENKKAHIAAKLRLVRPDLRILDIGCGWGGLALYLEKMTGADVTGITLSSEQLKIAKSRAEAAGVADRARFALKDYRRVTGTFDRIVSVGMFEHVGTACYDAFFETVGRLLADDGVALIHTIGRTGGPDRTDPFIRKYIFPGGYIPALSEILPSIERAGLFVTDIECLRLHYMLTLEHWYARAKAAKTEIAALGGNGSAGERFWRMWMYYLACSIVSFRHLGNVVYQIQLSRRVDALPVTRDYMMDAERAYLAREDAKPVSIRLQSR